MTPEEIAERVADIAHMAGDPEMAHAHEDQMVGEVLRAIAEGRCADPARCAAEVLKSYEIDFPRWCA